MSIRSMFAVITSLAFCFTACRYWGPDYDLYGHDVGLVKLLPILFEAVWSYVNWLGVRECKRIAAGPHGNGAVTALLIGFALIIVFQIVFFLRAYINVLAYSWG